MLALSTVLQALEGSHGPPPPPPSRDVWELVLLRQASTFVDDETRLATLAALKEQVGTRPSDLIEAAGADLERVIAGGGPEPAVRADRLVESARTLTMSGLGAPGALSELARTRIAVARRVLSALPMLRVQDAERILVAAGLSSALPLEAQGLRVLRRLGFGGPKLRWEPGLREVLAELPDPPSSPAEAWSALELLRVHGEQVCKRSRPVCEDCPLDSACRTALDQRARDSEGPPRLR